MLPSLHFADHSGPKMGGTTPRHGTAFCSVFGIEENAFPEGWTFCRSVAKRLVDSGVVAQVGLRIS
jgi:hypothetical protein